MGEAFGSIYLEEGREGREGGGKEEERRSRRRKEQDKRKRDQDNCVGRPRSDLSSSRPEEGILVGCQSQGGGTK